MRGLCLTVGTRTTNGRSILHSDPSSRFRVPNVPSQMSPTGVPGSGGVGYGLMNEPNPGWIGIHDLTQAWQWSHSSNSLTPCVPRVAAPPPNVPPTKPAWSTYKWESQLGPCCTPLQSLALGAGIPTAVEVCPSGYGSGFGRCCPEGV